MSTARFIGPRPVSSSFDTLLQISGSILVDGTGSMLPDVNFDHAFGGNVVSGSTICINNDGSKYLFTLRDTSNNLAFSMRSTGVVQFYSMSGIVNGVPAPAIGLLATDGLDLFISIDETGPF